MQPTIDVDKTARVYVLTAIQIKQAGKSLSDALLYRTAGILSRSFVAIPGDSQHICKKFYPGLQDFEIING
jgi:hypothetical protein